MGRSADGHPANAGQIDRLGTALSLEGGMAGTLVAATCMHWRLVDSYAGANLR